MKSKILTSLLGVFASALILYILDPYVPDSAIAALQKMPRAPGAEEALLVKLQTNRLWLDFDPFQIPAGVRYVERRQKMTGQKWISSKYAVMAPNSEIHDTLSIKLGDRTNLEPIFASTYRIDDHSRRVTVPAGPKVPKMQLAFLGCSFTWGQGVEDGETFSSIVAHALPKARILNLGIRGGAPHDFIDDLVEYPHRLTKDGISRGVVVLTLIGDQIERAFCKTRCYTRPYPFPGGPPALQKTRYVLKDGNLVSAGAFRDQGEAWVRLKTWLFRSRIYTKFLYDYSGFPNDDDLLLFAKMVERIRDITAQRTGYDFIVAFFPDTESSSTQKLLELFDKLHISYFDYSKLQFEETLGHRAFFALDRHPTRLGHAAYAELLLNDLKKRTPKIFESN